MLITFKVILLTLVCLKRVHEELTATTISFNTNRVDRGLNIYIQEVQPSMVSSNEEGRRRRGLFGLASYGKEWIQIKVPPYAVITAMIKATKVFNSFNYQASIPITRLGNLYAHGDYVKRP